MSVPTQQKALVLESKGAPLVVQNIDVDQPGDDDILVKVEAIGLNPGDWKIFEHDMLKTYPAILGFDGAGTVVKAGRNVTTLSVGDIAAFQGAYDFVAQAIKGTWMQYYVCPARFAAKIPASITSDAAATVPSGMATAAIPLYNQGDVGLIPPWAEGGRGKYTGIPFLVLGGASCVGQFVVQLARLSGFSPIITTASLHNTEFLESLGATHVLDRKLPAEELKAEAMKIAGGHFDYVYDSISLPETVQPGYDLLSPKGDMVIVLSSSNPKKEGSEKKVHMARGMFSLPMNAGIGAEVVAALTRLLESGDINPNRPDVMPGGLNAIAGGLERLKNDGVSGVKLVARPHETA